ncbi:MAG: hypothetical protein JSS17_05895 [Proteobacteria bacterium]|nr:hypothetical protein [Pseudomonadota bacterium]
MQRWIKWIAWLLFVLVVFVAGAAAAGVVMAELRLGRHVEVAIAPLAVPGDATSVERDRSLFASRGCAECHGASGGWLRT